MANSVQRDKNGPDWPLGSIAVPTPGTPVEITSLIDATGTDASSPTIDTEYPTRFATIEFQGFKSNAGTGAVPNTGNIYIVRKGVGAGSGNRTDFGSIVAIVAPGQTYQLPLMALSVNMYNPYRYFIDADNANDAAQVTGFVAG